MHINTARKSHVPLLTDQWVGNLILRQMLHGAHGIEVKRWDSAQSVTPFCLPYIVTKDTKSDFLPKKSAKSGYLRRWPPPPPLSPLLTPSPMSEWYVHQSESYHSSLNNAIWLMTRIEFGSKKLLLCIISVNLLCMVDSGQMCLILKCCPSSTFHISCYPWCRGRAIKNLRNWDLGDWRKRAGKHKLLLCTKMCLFFNRWKQICFPPPKKMSKLCWNLKYKTQP